MKFYHAYVEKLNKMEDYQRLKLQKNSSLTVCKTQLFYIFDFIICTKLMLIN